MAFFQEIVIGVRGVGLARGFWCFVLKDDEGAQFAQSSLSSLGLAISSNMHCIFHNNILNKPDPESELTTQNFYLLYFYIRHRIFRKL